MASPERKKLISLDEFTKNYQSQVIQWEKRRNVSKPAETDSDLGLDANSFKPKINLRSKQLANDIEKIENRVKLLNEGKQKKLEYL